MQFWIDIRLATGGGESVKRHRLTGQMRPEMFDELRDKVLGCVGECALEYDIEEDRTRIGLATELSAE